MLRPWRLFYSRNDRTEQSGNAGIETVGLPIGVNAPDSFRFSSFTRRVRRKSSYSFFYSGLLRFLWVSFPALRGGSLGLFASVIYVKLFKRHSTSVFRIDHPVGPEHFTPSNEVRLEVVRQSM